MLCALEHQGAENPKFGPIAHLSPSTCFHRVLALHRARASHDNGTFDRHEPGRHDAECGLATDPPPELMKWARLRKPPRARATWPSHGTARAPAAAPETSCVRRCSQGAPRVWVHRARRRDQRGACGAQRRATAECWLHANGRSRSIAPMSAWRNACSVVLDGELWVLNTLRRARHGPGHRRALVPGREQWAGDQASSVLEARYRFVAGVVGDFRPSPAASATRGVSRRPRPSARRPDGRKTRRCRSHAVPRVRPVLGGRSTWRAARGARRRLNNAKAGRADGTCVVGRGSFAFRRTPDPARPSAPAPKDGSGGFLGGPLSSAARRSFRGP